MVAPELDMIGGFDEWAYDVSLSFTSQYDLAERNAFIHECRMKMFSVLGAVVRCGSLLYWRMNDAFIAYVVGPAKKAFLNRRQACSLHWRRTCQ